MSGIYSIEELLPALGMWIKKFKDKIFILKYGGELLIPGYIEKYVDDIDFLTSVGIYPVIVHGFGPQLDNELQEQGIDFEKRNGIRVYSEEILKIASDISFNLSEIFVSSLSSKNIRTEYISYKEIEALKRSDYGFVGEIRSIKTSSLDNCFYHNMIPIVPSFAVDKQSGEKLCVNADNMASFLASALKAKKLIIHSAVNGVYGENGDVLSHLDSKEALRFINSGIIKDGMVPKVLSSLETDNVEKVHIIDGRIPHALFYEVFTYQGIGTEITR